MILEDDFWGEFEIDGGDLGTLRPLTLLQLAKMRKAIHQDMAAMGCYGLSGDELAKANAGIASHVAGMSLLTQALTVIRSPELLATAAMYMSPVFKGKQTTPLIVADKIKRECIPALTKAVYQSYGVRIAEDVSEAANDQSDPTEPTANSKNSPDTSPLPMGGPPIESVG